jgi:hypothetical protein
MRITIAIASRGCDIYCKLVDWLVCYAQEPPKGWVINTYVVMSPYSAACGQEKLFQKAVEDCSDYLFIVDADVCPPKGCLEKMVVDGKDIVIAPVWHYDMTQYDIHLGVNKDLKLRERLYNVGSGVEEIVGGGFGAMLVSKGVLDEFVRRGESFVHHSSMLSDGQSTFLSDNVFFFKAGKMGFKTWVDWDISPVSHYRYVELCDKTVGRLRDTAS